MKPLSAIQQHKVTDLTLFAVNTGELYSLHQKLARGGVPTNAYYLPIAAWYRHVRYCVVPLYRKQINAAAVFGDRVIMEAAKAIQEHYRNP
jgi:hypothetical protein